MSLYLGNQKVTPSTIYKENKLQELISGTLTELNVSDFEGCSKIAEYAFYNTKSLTTVHIGQDVKTVEKYSFYNCGELVNVSFGGVRDIGESAFGYCRKIESGINVSNVENFGRSCFYQASNLRYFAGGLSPNLKRVEAGAFNDTQIGNPTFPASLEYLGAFAFYITSYDGFGRDIVFLGQVPDLPNDVFNFVKTLDCRYCTRIPVLQSTSSIGWFRWAAHKQCIVPDNLYDEWINYTNWASYTEVDFIKASEA